MPSGEELILLIIGVAYLGCVCVFIWRLQSYASEMLRIVHDNVSPKLWEDIGSPESMQQAVKDPKRRWMKFIRSGDYKRRCPMRVIEAIEQYRRKSNRMMFTLALCGTIILYRFWPLLKPDFL